MEMNTTIFIFALISMITTLGVCFAGIILMAVGGEKNTHYGNKLMAARVKMQAVSLVLVALSFV